MEITKNSKGITLVALVITIIVLIILATISINLVINGGLINQAEKAAQAQTNAEEHDAQALDGLDKRIDEILKNRANLQEDEEETVPDILSQYVLGEEGEGVLATSIFDMETMKFKGEDTVIPNAEEELIFMDAMRTTSGMYVLFGYEEQAYIAEVGTNYYTKDLYVGVNKIWSGEQQVVHVDVDGHGVPDFSQLEDTTTGTQLNNLSKTISKNKMYAIHVVVDGVHTLLLTETYRDLIFHITEEPVILTNINNVQIIVGLKENGKICVHTYGATNKTVIVQEIYEVKSFVNYAEENGIGIRRVSQDLTWEICKTPSTSYTVPQVIGNYPVERVDLVLMSGIANFTSPIEAFDIDNPSSLDGIKITSTDTDFISTLLNCFEDDEFFTGSIDLTACGDDVEIPSKLLDVEEISIYVSDGAYENYSSYSNVYTAD